ncbi:MAG TPA: hypothetical protein VG406_02935 [Isosphaeraceae bacterium]|jgi:hypothetical protein|nr:hypothetical protein [Isosphaeraceae bacterium]
MACVLTVDGVVIPLGVAPLVEMNRLYIGLDEYSSIEFAETAATLPGRWKPGMTASLDEDGVRVFSGEVTTRQRRQAETGWGIGYRALDLKYLANKIPITNPNDLTGVIRLNLPWDDPLYSPTLAGQAVSQILAYLFNGHAPQLIAAGVGTTTSPSFDGFVPADLTALTQVPPEPIYLTGNLMDDVDRLLEKWAGRFACRVDPNGPVDGLGVRRGVIRILDTATFTPLTLTMGVDPIEWPDVQEDTSQCAGRMVVRGAGDIDAALASIGHGTLAETWTAGDETSWDWDAFVTAGGGSDSGAITALTSTTATVQSTDATRAWAANFWGANAGQVAVINPVSTGITQTEWRNVISCTALAAGGTSVLTLDRPLDNAGYTRYTLSCHPAGTLADVYRRYRATSTYVAAHLAPKFNKPKEFVTATEVLSVMYPTAEIFGAGGVGWAAKFNIDQANGDIVFAEPTVKALNDQPTLNAGGAGVVKPTDVLALLAYSRGTLTATYPADVGGVAQYTGTFHSTSGVGRTAYYEVPSWLDAGQASNMLQLAQLLLDPRQDVIYEGSATYRGKLSSALALGQALNVAGDDGASYPTGMEAMAATIRGVTLEWPKSGDIWRTKLTFSNRRRLATGVEMYIHPTFQGRAAWDLGRGAGGSGPDFGSLLAGLAVGMATGRGGVSAAGWADDGSGMGMGMEMGMGMGMGQVGDDPGAMAADLGAGAAGDAAQPPPKSRHEPAEVTRRRTAEVNRRRRAEARRRHEPAEVTPGAAAEAVRDPFATPIGDAAGQPIDLSGEPSRTAPDLPLGGEMPPPPAGPAPRRIVPEPSPVSGDDPLAVLGKPAPPPRGVVGPPRDDSVTIDLTTNGGELNDGQPQGRRRGAAPRARDAHGGGPADRPGPPRPGRPDGAGPRDQPAIPEPRELNDGRPQG